MWHVGKNIKKKLALYGKKKDCAEINAWIKSIINHFWWCCASCHGNTNELKEKWVSILCHVRNKHRWEEGQVYKRCEHGKLPSEVQRLKKWIKEGSPAFIALEKVVTDKRLICDLKYLVDFNHTGQLEVYHSLYLKYCPKRLHFSYPGMIARSQLAVMDFNSGVYLTQATTKNNEPRYKQAFSKVTNGWVVKKIKSPKEKAYLDVLMETTVDIKLRKEHVDMPDLTNVPKNISLLEKPDKKEAIKSLKTRFLCD